MPSPCMISTGFVSMDAWQQVLRKGCSGEKECAHLIASKGASMAGALLDAVADGDDAEAEHVEDSRIYFVTNTPTCVVKIIYTHMCALSLSFLKPDQTWMVLVFRRQCPGRDVATNADNRFDPGKIRYISSAKAHSRRVCGDCYRWCQLRVLESISDDPARCVVECGKTRQPRRADAASYGELGAPGAASCTPAERLCKKIKSVRQYPCLLTNQGFLKQLGTPWDSR